MILIDIAEPEEIKIKLGEKNKEVLVQSLPVGDYYICGEEGEIVLTRKTYTDLARSLKDATVWSEIGRMCDSQVEKKAMILEGNINDLHIHTDFQFPAVVGALLSISIDWEFPIIHANDIAQTVYFITQLNERMGKDKVVRHWKLRHLPKIDESERPRYIIEGLPSIGAKKAKTLLATFKTPLDVLLAEKKELEAIDGIGKKLAENIYNAARQEYKPKERSKKG